MEDQVQRPVEILHVLRLRPDDLLQMINGCLYGPLPLSYGQDTRLKRRANPAAINGQN